LLFFTLSLLVYGVNAQVTNSSYTTGTGEKVLRFSIVVPLSKAAAWDLFTKDDQLVKWIAPVVHIELKTGGYILTNYDKTKSLSDSSSIRLGIVNYLENELLTLKVKLNKSFPKQAQDEDTNLQEVLQFVEMAPGKTKIISSMIGWGTGEHWDKTYRFFEAGNVYTFEELLKLFQ
jgi:hypothetical protein